MILRRDFYALPSLRLLSLLLCLGFWQVAGAQPLVLSGDIAAVHDPTLIRAGDKYFVFSTGRGLPIRCSNDLTNWTQCRAVFFGWPDWIRAAVPAAGDLWAPDVSFYDGLYQVYYVASSFTNDPDRQKANS